MVFATLILAVHGNAAAQSMIDAESALQEQFLGDLAAPVTMIEYVSMTCPLCASFHNDTLVEFKERYVDTGKVRLVYRDFPLDGIALRAAMMARCAAPPRYFALVQLLYKTQREWSRSQNPVAELAKIGELAGVDRETFQACLASEDLLNGVLKIRQEGAAMGLQSTPTFFINGKAHLGSRSFEELAEIIDPSLAGK